jgi:hypothetical protein
MHDRILNTSFFERNTFFPGAYIADDGDFLVATKTGTLSLNDKNSMFSEERLKLTEQKAIETISASARAAGRDYFSVPTFDSANSDSAKSDENFIRKVSSLIPYLKNIFRSPISRLHTEENSLPLGRVIKISSKADIYLANHPEDWQAKSIFGHIIPEKILSEERFENYDIYENRLALFLLVQLIKKVKRIRDTFYKRMIRDEQMELFSSQLLSAGFYAARRVCKLWQVNIDGLDSLKTSEMYDISSQLLSELSRFHEFRLSRKLHLSERRNIKLKVTNILSSDANYRYLVDLWGLWRTQDPEYFWTDEQFLKNEKKLHKDFYSVSLLYIGRALSNLQWRLKKNDNLNIKPEAVLCFLKKVLLNGIDVTLNLMLQVKINRDFTFTLSLGKTEILHIVPIYYDFSEEEIERLQSLQPEQQTLIVYPHFQKDLTSIANRSHKISFVALSVMNILSVECLAREIRWAIYQTYLNRPRKLDEKVFKPIFPLFSFDEYGFFSDLSSLRIFYEKIKTNENFNDYYNDMRQNKQRGNLAGALKNARDQHKLVDAISSLLNTYLFLMRCPVCGEINTRSVRGWQPLRAKCDNCKTEWGEYQCGTCKKTYPYIKLSFKWDPGKTNFLSVAGRDMLCEYICDEAGIARPTCPFC